MSGDAFIIDQGWSSYTAEEHQTWKRLYERQRALLPGRACDELIQGMDDLDIGAEGIPNFDDLNEKLSKTTGWEVVAVPGLIPDEPFFELLSRKKFPAGNFIRKPHQLDYIEEPDVFHDVFGHVPLLNNQVYADHMQAYGFGGLRAKDHGTVKNLARLYWYTIEFGLMNTKNGLRIYGAGIVSSPGETIFALDDPSPNRLQFDVMRIMQTDYIIDDYQQIYFALDSFEQLYKETDIDFEPLYKQLKAENKTYQVDALAKTDVIITRGTQAYAKAKKTA
ncbi:MAG: phenylalanine 4-monooxygenase [Micavibrio sp.]|nr:phenylalanine 4-monooxygenase [Micavibrio sp.]|tara:strand:- start:487 stop:1320 length:834 start_codon:yes stop_codon:yes gene_type:complete